MNKIESFSLNTLRAKFDLNWSNDSGRNIENVKSSQDWQKDRKRTDKQSEKLTWAYSSSWAKNQIRKNKTQMVTDNVRYDHKYFAEKIPSQQSDNAKAYAYEIVM